MPKRSPWERHYKREREINRRVFDLAQSTKHMCLCGHAQGFHWDTDDGKNVGECVDADCPCTAFDEDVLAEARLRAELQRPAATQNPAVLDALRELGGNPDDLTG